MFTSIEKLLTNARIKLPGAIDAALLSELFNVVDMFCRRSDANRYATPIPITAGVSKYTVTYDHEVVVRVFNIAHEVMDTAGTYYDADDGSLALPNAPTVAEALYVVYLNVSLAPKAGSDNPDDWMPELIWQRYYSVVLDGLLSSMHGQTAKPYYNAQLATFYGRRFRNGINLAKQQTAVGQAPNAASWRFPTHT